MEKIITQIIECFKNGNKLMIVGNGGSAAQAQHMAAELIGRFEHERKALPALALTTDSSILTSIGNDYSFENVFSRQIEALGKKGDLLLVLTTSGKSRNCLLAATVALEKGIEVLTLPFFKNKSTAEIQEEHLKIIHDICREVEKEFL